jgi:hypothetical protein
MVISHGPKFREPQHINWKHNFNFTANAVSVAIGDNGNRLIFEIWWNFFYDLFSIKNVADVNSINILMLKIPLNQERYKILLMIYFLIYRNLLEFITFVQSYFHYL